MLVGEADDADCDGPPVCGFPNGVRELGSWVRFFEALISGGARQGNVNVRPGAWMRPVRPRQRLVAQLRSDGCVRARTDRPILVW